MRRGDTIVISYCNKRYFCTFGKAGVYGIHTYDHGLAGQPRTEGGFFLWHNIDKVTVMT